MLLMVFGCFRTCWDEWRRLYETAVSTVGFGPSSLKGWGSWVRGWDSWVRGWGLWVRGFVRFRVRVGEFFLSKFKFQLARAGAGVRNETINRRLILTHT